jgi:hypothetical protein
MLVPFNFTLEEMIMQDTKKMILQNAALLNIRLNQKDKKAVLAKRFADTILKEPKVVLRCLPYTELLRLKEMAHNKNHAVPYRINLVTDCISLIGLTDHVTIKDVDYEFIYPDLAEALKPVIDNYVESMDHGSGKFRFIRIVLGLLNLYGLIPFLKLARLCRSLDMEFAPDELMQTIDNSYLLSLQATYLPGKSLCYKSPFLDDIEYLIKETESRHFNDEARFSLDEVLAAGEDEKPQPPENAMTGKVKEMLLSLLGSEEEVSEWISRSWMLLNNDSSPVDLIQGLFDKQGFSLEQLNKYISVVMDWANLLPRWIMKGYSSRKIYETYEKPVLQQRPPKLIMGPNARKEGISVSQEEFNESWRANVKKPGRNDPCPCGSGKKYKHCCGKTR